MEKIYYAKSPQADGHQPFVKEHLEAVSKLAGHFGAVFGCQAEAMIAGKFHDFGKYSVLFQDGVLPGLRQHIDHAICGAEMLYLLKHGKRAYRPIMEAINAHHSSLLDYDMLKGILDQVIQDEQEHTSSEGKIAALNGIAQYQAAFQAFREDFPDFSLPKLQSFLPGDAQPVASMLYTRMLFSCLVDADYSISASDRDPDYLHDTEISSFDPNALLEKLNAYRKTIRKNSDSSAEVNQIRDMLFDRCGEAGTQPEGLFTLTAPTGTGKTLALLHFALQHCAARGKKRIIIVLPFLTLAEQNVRTYENILPDILVDHSQSDLPEEAREFSARWTVPVIVTTSVHFFESLFSSKPTDCRKLHSIANSVVLFDEAQSLPSEVTGCTLQAVRELCARYHCTMVFSTATQPNFETIDSTWKPQEIVTDHSWMYHALQRVSVRWNIESPTALAQIAEEMAQEKNVCTIVNLRRHGRKLFELLKAKCPPEELFFLTTDLCAAHRSEVVAEIHRRQESDLPCRVVATQCIEAGIDLDFDVLYRALAPLDSIIQAAGRCNRNGRLSEYGSVTVFIPAEDGRLYPDSWYHNAATVVQRLAARHPIDINDPQHILEYYQILFQNHKDKPALAKAIANRSFSETDQAYQLIKASGYQIIVPFKGLKELYDTIKSQLEDHGLTNAILKQAASITVTTFEKEIEQYAEQLYYIDHRTGESSPSQYFILRPQHHALYLSDMGLQFPAAHSMEVMY